MIATLNSSMMDFVRGQQAAETQFVARSDIAFKQLSQQYEMRMNQFVHTFEESLSGRMDMVFAGVLTRQQEILVISDELYARWSDLTYNAYGLSESFSALSSQVTKSIAVVDVLNRQAVRIHDTQANALRSAAGLVETFDHLMTTTNRQLEAINGTAVAIQESLIAQSRGNGIWDGWDGRWVINVAGSFLHPDSTLLLSVLNHPAFGILFGFMGFVCSTLCHTLATLISMLLCFFLSSKVFIWKLLSGSSLYSLSQPKDIKSFPASSSAYSLQTPQPRQYLHLDRPPPSTLPLVPPGYRRLSSRFALYANSSASRIPERLYRTSNP
ncbi:hypothetical protein BDQ12DRAFT_388954 [Crucibulum laeve]|uniref:Uncharacterized protein n=1 Tax=Crucibulum laeve TaxID=68775 RepID=A0A5C3M8G5_9AGAR|nr:hypothetical protein BDQ12DRAFT_388954 [Crucibulum laeve]